VLGGIALHRHNETDTAGAVCLPQNTVKGPIAADT
jgi:hypothetical protein